MKISVAQTLNYQGDKEAFFKTAEKLIEKAVSQGSEFIVFPELASCGYIPNEAIWYHAETNEGKTPLWTVQMAKKYNVYLGMGYIETDEKDFYNSYIIVSKKGDILGNIRKWKTEVHLFKSVFENNIVETEFGKVAVGICADNHQLKFYKCLGELDFDLFIMPHASFAPITTSKYVKEKDVLKQNKILFNLAKLYSNNFQISVAIANQIGKFSFMRGMFGKLISNDNYALAGNSIIYSATGEYLSLDKQEDVITFEVPLRRANKQAPKPKSSSGWLYPGSRIVRRIIAPIDRLRGKYFYFRKHKKVLQEMANKKMPSK